MAEILLHPFATTALADETCPSMTRGVQRTARYPRPVEPTPDDAQEQGADGAVAVYATAAGLASVVPVPWLDDVLCGLARGAAVRRVAGRHGVRLDKRARAILAAPEAPERGAGKARKLVRAVAARLVAPLRVVKRVEGGLSAFASALLFDHYLATADRRPGAPVLVDEAWRVRAAIDAATVGGVAQAMRRVPIGTWRAFSGAAKAAIALDEEDRPPLERTVDALLDAAADAPDDLASHLRTKFDAALAADVLEDES